jgi:predicted O-methyltransferase YrrM
MDFDRLNEYINGLYRQQDQLSQAEFIAQTQLKDFIPVVDDDVARFLKLLIRITRPQRVLEIGTSIGYSTVCMAQMLREYGGRLTTLEYDPVVAAQARQNFIRTGVADWIDLRVGDACQIVPTLAGPYDLIFQDVDKRLYPLLFDDCLRLLRSGGILVAEDTLFPVLDLDEKWRELIAPIRQFNAMVVGSPALQSTLLPIGDGVIVAVKR